MPTRRRFLHTAAALGGTTLLPFSARAQDQAGDIFKGMSGQIEIAPIQHASFVMQTPAGVIYSDPVGGAELYEGQPQPDLILVTHEHGDHFDLPTLQALMGGATALVVNPAVGDMLPPELADRADTHVLANGETLTLGDVEIEAIPAYNTTPERMQYHPEGRDNGYVLTVDNKRIYIAGDTEDIPEMRALEDIMIAFVPMNLPYTMTAEQAADGVNEFQPEFVYPYHYRGTDPEAFAALVEGPAVRMGPWYAEDGEDNPAEDGEAGDGGTEGSEGGSGSEPESGTAEETSDGGMSGDAGGDAGGEDASGDTSGSSGN